MSSKSRIGAVLKSVRQELKDDTKKRKVLSPPNMSSIEKASFLDDNDISFSGNPLHSTALDDDLSPALKKMTKPSKSSVKRKAPNVSTDKSTKTTLKAKGTLRKKASAVKSRSKITSLKRKVTTEKRRGSEVSASCDTLPEERSLEEDGSDSAPSGPAMESARKSRGKGTTKATTPAVQKKMSPAVSEDHSPSSPEIVLCQRNSAATARRNRMSSLSSEDLSDEDPCWHEPKQQKNYLPNNVKRRSSSGSPTVKRKVTSKKRNILFGPSDANKPPKKKRGRGDKRSVIDLEVVLTAFQDFVSNYIKTLDSGTVTKAVNAFSESVESQLTQHISEKKGLNSLKKQNVKMNGAINRKTARLIEVKNELIKKEMELRKLQKEHSQLEERLTDIRTSTAFLADLQDLQKSYLAYRENHPNEVEVYGPSSLPALLFEARSVMGAEHQLSIINHKLQQGLDQSNPITIDSNEK
ncbi:centromere protein U isoform X2 [Brienomyrus brachyistius]|uniref:centromere protein U isoform X2 n=1 Tax=Brienomyrus brachyistius TaxID=42636 RepID=UPI0020B38BAE|nr:centromere protein U isoform X2 [Brienomyrus brachyistius]